MIFNRTLADVEAAKSIRTNKVQKGIALTDSEIVTLELGMLTVNTLNRIENKQAELWRLLNAEAYQCAPIVNKSWTYADMFAVAEFQRLLDNLDVLRGAFFVYADTPDTPTAAYHYKNINALEKILYDVEIMLDDMILRYRQCGTFQCGEVNEK